MLSRIFYIFGPLIFLAINLIGMASSWGQGAPVPPAEEPGGFVIPESIKGFDEQKVKNDPICDSSVRPQIDQVKPDEMKTGDTVVVQGKYFGKKKECLHGVTFGSVPAKAFSFVDDERVEAVVPEGLRSGVTFLNVETGGGTARKGILIQSKD
jgi:IPT/TIG domain